MPFSFVSQSVERGLAGMNAITNQLRRELLAAQTILFKPFPRGTRAVKSLASSDLVDFEFSDYGRDPYRAGG
jgi:hypothetical protein